ncbi:hypothetical protein [Microcoleus anatoxicus]|uniref:Uncharacterized protein n=1 Tax=Microcoleus anatoxicus PTRS2 TaxID=2705321 RepID=A0ABU8YSB7_9CYAN
MKIEYSSSHAQNSRTDRLERRADLLVSTLQSYIAAMGGELSFVVEFKDRPPVKITGLKSMFEESSYTTNGEEECGIQS